MAQQLWPELKKEPESYVILANGDGHRIFTVNKLSNRIVEVCIRSNVCGIFATELQSKLRPCHIYKGYKRSPPKPRLWSQGHLRRSEQQTCHQQRFQWRTQSRSHGCRSHASRVRVTCGQLGWHVPERLRALRRGRSVLQWEVSGEKVWRWLNFRRWWLAEQSSQRRGKGS